MGPVPPTAWYACPECDPRLDGQSLVHATDDSLAVTYSSTNETCLARWGWETATDELSYRGEAEVGDMGEPDSDE